MIKFYNVSSRNDECFKKIDKDICFARVKKIEIDSKTYEIEDVIYIVDNDLYQVYVREI